MAIMSKFDNKFPYLSGTQASDKAKKATPNKKESTSPSSIVPKRGRPKGKRSDPDFEQVTAYVRSETYRKTKIALLQQEEFEDFSELVEDLLSDWLSRKQKGKNLDI